MVGETTAHEPPDDGPPSRAQLEAELRMVDEEIEQARRAAVDARQAIGGRSEGAVDSSDRSAAIEQAEEQEELVGILTDRRERLQQRIRALS
jgi:hypothetical protein